MASSSRQTDLSSYLNKGARAKLAKHTINETIPKLLKHHPFALSGIKNTELIRYSSNQSIQTYFQPASSSSSSTPTPQAPIIPRVRVTKSDTLDAVHSILSSSNNPKIKVCALNMASSLRPGGGVLQGAIAQEETLCMRSTLYASLSPQFYRLPDNALIYSPSILVFRSAANTDLPTQSYYYTDIISCAALRQPPLIKVSSPTSSNPQREVYRYEFSEDRESTVVKVRHILQIAKEKGVTHLVLGALGCGAYRNPPEEVAEIFRREIMGYKNRKPFEGIEEISFAIFDEGENLRVFRGVFGS